MADYGIDENSQNYRRGASPLFKYGSCTVGTTKIPVWDGASAYTFPTTAETIRIKAGGNVADTTAGAGAREVIAQGLSETFEFQEATLTTDGANASAASTEKFSRVWRAWPSQVGTYGGANVGAITIENTTSNQDLAIITAGEGQTLMSIYTVALKTRLYLENINVHVEGVKTANIFMYQRQEADNWSTAPFASKRIVKKAIGLTGAGEIKLDKHVWFPEKTDLWIEGVFSSGSGEIEASFSGELRSLIT